MRQSFYRGVRLTIVRLIHLRSAGTCGSVRLREVSVLWDVRLKKFHCILIVACLIARRNAYRENFD